MVEVVHRGSAVATAIAMQLAMYIAVTRGIARCGDSATNANTTSRKLRPPAMAAATLADACRVIWPSCPRSYARSCLRSYCTAVAIPIAIPIAISVAISVGVGSGGGGRGTM